MQPIHPWLHSNPLLQLVPSSAPTLTVQGVEGMGRRLLCGWMEGAQAVEGVVNSCRRGQKAGTMVGDWGINTRRLRHEQRRRLSPEKPPSRPGVLQPKPFSGFEGASPGRGQEEHLRGDPRTKSRKEARRKRAAKPRAPLPCQEPMLPGGRWPTYPAAQAVAPMPPTARPPSCGRWTPGSCRSSSPR